MEIDQALGYLDQHINLEKMVALAGRTEGLSLDRMRVVADVLGDPQTAYPAIQVTGTNGKGSTTRMISALLAAHDLTVGTFTSPHVEDITERIARNGEPIDPDELARVIGDLATLEPLLLEELQGQRPSYFELLTAVAYSYFAEVAVQAAVVEVGMLGRFDATNVIDAEVAVVTNIGKDHTDGTGDWRRRIAEEKAGIIGPGSRLVLGEPDPDLLGVFEAEEPEERWVRDRDFGVVTSAAAVGGRVLDLRTHYGSYDQVFLPLHGAHQADNAACAVAAVEAFFGRAIDHALLREAFAGLELPGRCEVLHRGPLALLDGAHNPDGARALASTLAEEFSVGGRRRWVVGLLTGRDIDEMLDDFGIGSDGYTDDQLIACTPPTPRGVSAEDVAGYASKRGIDAVVVPDVAEAVTHAWALAQAPDAGSGAEAAGGSGSRPDPSGGASSSTNRPAVPESLASIASVDAPASTDAVIVTGSLYTVGAARPTLRSLV